jgi:hypothetical protein
MAAHEGFVALGQRIFLITSLILCVDTALMLHLNSSHTQQMGQGAIRDCISTASPHTTPLEFGKESRVDSIINHKTTTLFID